MKDNLFVVFIAWPFSLVLYSPTPLLYMYNSKTKFAHTIPSIAPQNKNNFVRHRGWNLCSLYSLYDLLPQWKGSYVLNCLCKHHSTQPLRHIENSSIEACIFLVFFAKKEHYDLIPQAQRLQSTAQSFTNYIIEAGVFLFVLTSALC